MTKIYLGNLEASQIVPPFHRLCPLSEGEKTTAMTRSDGYRHRTTKTGMETKTKTTVQWTKQGNKETGFPLLKNHSIVHFNEYLYCFGGYNGRVNSSTLLIYSIQDGKWIRPHYHGTADDGRKEDDDSEFIVSGKLPAGRNGHTATLVVNPKNVNAGRIIIIGGWLGCGPLAASDMHIIDISTDGKQLTCHRPESINGVPPGTYDYVIIQHHLSYY